MLAELLVALGVRPPRAVDRLGLSRRAAATWARGRRHAQAWRPHLEHSRAAILTAADAVEGGRSCLLLGSGPLFDVPLDALRRRFRQVILADVAHPPAARWAAWRRPDVRLVTVDISGALAALAQLRPGEEPPPPDCDAFLEDPSIDLVVSLNLASQIALPAIDWLETRPGWSAERAGAYGRRMIAAHFDYLRRFHPPMRLISDYALWEYDADDRRSPPEDTLAGLTPPPPPLARWDWRLAPPGELHPERGVGLSVGVWDRLS